MLKMNLQLFASVGEQTVHAGHTILIKYGAAVIGKARGLEGERSFGTEGVYEIGSIMPQEHIPLRYEGSFTLERFLVRGNDLKRVGLVSLGEEILKKGAITIEVVDKYTGALVRAYHGCTLVSYRETMRANDIAGENATFTYLFAKGADETSNA